MNFLEVFWGLSSLACKYLTFYFLDLGIIKLDDCFLKLLLWDCTDAVEVWKYTFFFFPSLNILYSFKILWIFFGFFGILNNAMMMPYLLLFPLLGPCGQEGTRKEMVRNS